MPVLYVIRGDSPAAVAARGERELHEVVEHLGSSVVRGALSQLDDAQDVRHGGNRAATLRSTCSSSSVGAGNRSEMTSPSSRSLAFSTVYPSSSDSMGATPRQDFGSATAARGPVGKVVSVCAMLAVEQPVGLSRGRQTEGGLRRTHRCNGILARRRRRSGLFRPEEEAFAEKAAPIPGSDDAGGGALFIQTTSDIWYHPPCSNLAPPGNANNNDFRTWPSCPGPHLGGRTSAMGRGGPD